MKQNKKLISFAVAVAMIMTMLSSFVIVNAAEKVIYTEAEKSENGITLKVGYKGFTEFGQLGGYTVKVEVPEGLDVTVNDVTSVAPFDAGLGTPAVATVNGKKIVTVGKVNTEGYDLDATGEGVIATINFKWANETAPTVDTPFDFVLNDAILTMNDSDLTEYFLGSDFTASNGRYNFKAPVVEPSTKHIYAYGSVVAEGKATITVGYKNFPADFGQLGGYTIKVEVPDGFDTTVNDVVPVAPFDAGLGTPAVATVNGKKIVTVGKVNTEGYDLNATGEGVIATITLTLNDGVTVGSDVDVTIADAVLTMNDSDLTEYFLGTDFTSFTKPITAEGGENPPAEGEVTGVTLDKTEFTAKAGATVTITATVEGTTENKDVTATATNGATVTVDGNVVKVTVPDTAETGDEITVTVAAEADATKTATAKITVNNPAYEIKGADETFKVNGKTNKMFKPAITVDDAEKFAAAFNDTESYRIVFDFRTAKNANAGYGLFVVTGAQLKAIAGGADAGIYSTVSGAASAELHIETTSGDIK